MDTMTALLISIGIVGFIALIKENAKYSRYEFVQCKACGWYGNYGDLLNDVDCPRCNERIWSR